MVKTTSSLFLRGLMGVAVFSMLAPAAVSGQRVINFDDLTLEPDSYYNGSDGAGGFSSGGASFNNNFETFDGWDFWGGWSYSNVSDTETPGHENQYAAFTGEAIGQSGIYGVAYLDAFNDVTPRITLPEGESALSVQVTNTTYAALAILDGDAFGTDPFGQGDYFYLTITGFDASDAPTGSTEFYLADYRFDDEALFEVVNEWASVDVSGFGPETTALEFEVTSSEEMTPTYFALGEVTVIPEPGTYALLFGLGAMGFCAWRRGSRKNKQLAD